MTPALKAMVEAMAAELRRQHEDDPVGAFVEQVGSSEMLFGVQVDLEKVARAGLSAIPPEELAKALYVTQPLTEPGDPDEPDEPLNGVRVLPWSDVGDKYQQIMRDDARTVLDAILKDAP